MSPPSSAVRPVFENEQTLDKLDALDTLFTGISTESFSKEIQSILSAPLDVKDIECKPGNTYHLTHYDNLLLFYGYN